MESMLWEGFLDIHETFRVYDALYFEGRLGDVRLSWSGRLRSSAGICKTWSSRGIVKRVEIHLAAFLAYLETPAIVSVLLHEMIHAYLTVTHTPDDSHHGFVWRSLACRINANEAMEHTGIVVEAFHTHFDAMMAARGRAQVARQRKVDGRLRRVPAVGRPNLQPAPRIVNFTAIRGALAAGCAACLEWRRKGPKVPTPASDSVISISD